MLVRHFFDKKCITYAASLSFSTLLAIIPLIGVAVSIMTSFTAFSNVQENAVHFLSKSVSLQYQPQVEEYVNTFLKHLVQMKALGVVSIIMIAVFLFLTVEDAFESIWTRHKTRPLLQRILVFWAMLTLFPLLLTAVISFSENVLDLPIIQFLGTLPFLEYIVEHVLAPLLLIGVLMCVFLYLPSTHIRFIDAFVGSTFTGISLILGKEIFYYYIQTIQSYQMIYGSLASIPILMVWLFISWAIILFGGCVAALLPNFQYPFIDLKGHTTQEETFYQALEILQVLQERGKLLQKDFYSLPLLQTYNLINTLDILSQNFYIQENQSGYWFLCCDLHKKTLYDLYADLGLQSLQGGIARHSLLKKLRPLVKDLQSNERALMNIPLHKLLTEDFS